MKRVRVFCHGFAWENDATSNPRCYHVKNIAEEGGYYGSVEGAPECGCIETMPVMDDAECSRFERRGEVLDCHNGLMRQYDKFVGDPNGSMERNTDMCCWTENSRREVADNTDVCHYGDTVHPDDEKGLVHCHGFA